MKRRFAILSFVVLLTVLLVAPNSAHATGPSIVITGLTSYGCNESDTNFDFHTSGFSGSGEFQDNGLTLNLFVQANASVYMNEDDSSEDINSSDNFSNYYANDYGPADGSFPLPSDTPVAASMTIRTGSSIVAESTITFICNTGQVLSIVSISNGLPAGAVMWFNPGDKRVDGHPGDRIAVWCNTTATPPNIVVYGVGDNATNGSHGFWLATFNNADLLKAGKAGITKNAGAGNGTVSAMQDGSGNFYVAWNGGIFKATGQGDFAKSFSCKF